MIHQHIPLSSCSTFQIGGPADYFADVADRKELSEVLRFAMARKLPLLIIGRGSNSLFSDLGFRGLALRLKMEECFCEDIGRYRVGAGYSFAQLGRQTAKEGRHGLEFAAGIPASVGGAICMNAGANGQETQQTLASVDVMDYEGRERTILRSEIRFAYRSSMFQQSKSIILSGTFQLSEDLRAEEEQKKIVTARIQSQPYKDKSCGCIFRNPQAAVFAGKLIQDSGLKGASIGGAAVSEMHANFIINQGGATCSDVIALMQTVRRTVLQQSGYLLEPEIRVFDEYGRVLNSEALFVSEV